MFKNLSLLVALVLFSVATTFAQKLPNIHILATGGTIAGTGSFFNRNQLHGRTGSHRYSFICCTGNSENSQCNRRTNR